MKSKFAKFVDYTLGSVLLFGATTAVAVYFMPLKLAAFTALSVTATACVIMRFADGRKTSAAHLSKAANDMFFEFMFLNPAAPAKMLYDGLKRRDDRAKLRGTGVYLGKTAAYPFLSSTPAAIDIARLISRAKHYGCNRVIIICKTPPTETLSVTGIKVINVSGDDAYRLYASLDCLPEKKYSTKQKRKFIDTYRGALSSDKIIRYAVLSAALFATSAIFGFSPVTLACACICAALFLASTVIAAVGKIKARKPKEKQET